MLILDQYLSLIFIVKIDELIIFQSAMLCTNVIKDCRLQFSNLNLIDVLLLVLAGWNHGSSEIA